MVSYQKSPKNTKYAKIKFYNSKLKLDKNILHKKQILCKYSQYINILEGYLLDSISKSYWNGVLSP